MARGPLLILQRSLGKKRGTEKTGNFAMKAQDWGGRRTGRGGRKRISRPHEVPTEGKGFSNGFSHRLAVGGKTLTERFIKTIPDLTKKEKRRENTERGKNNNKREKGKKKRRYGEGRRPRGTWWGAREKNAESRTLKKTKKG